MQLFRPALSFAVLVLSFAPLPARAQGGGRPPVAPPGKAPQKGDTAGVRRTPDGFVLDFQEQDLRVVLSAIAEAGHLNVVFANIPQVKTTVRMGQAVTREQALEILRGVAAVNDLKLTESPSLIRVEGTPPPRANAQQLAQAQQQQQQQQAQQLRLYTYRLKHANAVVIAPVLMQLLTGTGGTTGGRGNNAGNNNPGGFNIFGVPGGAGRGGNVQGNITVTPAAPPAAPGRGGGAAAQNALQNAIQNQVQALQQAFGGALGNQSGDIRIVAEEATNSLLVRSTAEDWALMQQLLTSIDLRPLQVLIEVTIAQVNRTHDLNVGLSGNETRKRTGSNIVDTTAILPSAASARDFIYLITGGKGTINYTVALNALQSRGDVKVLSLPVVIGQNGKEAILNVGSSVPFVSVQQTSGIDPTGRTQTIQYIDVGTTLTITPTINPDGYVNLAVKQTNNSATNNIQFNAPVISKREATTQVFIRDGQTTVLGGLTDNTESKSTSGIPFFSRLPLIGWIFGNTQRNDAITEFYLFLTPHIVSSDEDIDRLREAVKGQSELLQGVNVEAKIVPKGDTIQIGKPVRPRPDSLPTKRPEPR